MTTIGERVREKRTEKALSLAELARQAEISKGYLHSIETGETQSPSAEILFRIATLLGTTIAFLLGEDDGTVPSVQYVPPSLKAFAEQENLTEAEVQMLANIQYRGNKPDSKEDWRYIYESIKRTVRRSID